MCDQAATFLCDRSNLQLSPAIVLSLLISLCFGVKLLQFPDTGNCIATLFALTFLIITSDDPQSLTVDLFNIFYYEKESLNDRKHIS